MTLQELYRKENNLDENGYVPDNDYCDWIESKIKSLMAINQGYHRLLWSIAQSFNGKFILDEIWLKKYNLETADLKLEKTKEGDTILRSKVT